MTIDLDAIQARADAATEGPWFLDSNGVDQVFVGNRADGRQDGLWEIVHMSGDKLGDLKPECAERMRDDAVFIAHAREDVPALVAEVKHFQELVQVLNHRILDGDPDEIEAALESLPVGSIVESSADAVAGQEPRAWARESNGMSRDHIGWRGTGRMTMFGSDYLAKYCAPLVVR